MHDYSDMEEELRRHKEMTRAQASHAYREELIQKREVQSRFPLKKAVPHGIAVGHMQPAVQTSDSPVKMKLGTASVGTIQPIHVDEVSPDALWMDRQSFHPTDTPREFIEELKRELAPKKLGRPRKKAD